MLVGWFYVFGDGELVVMCRIVQGLMCDYNVMIIGDKICVCLLMQMLGIWNGMVVCVFFYVDYGKYIYFGLDCFVNFGCFFMDICEIRIGVCCQFGIGVQFLIEDCLCDVKECVVGVEWGKFIIIGDDVWVGGGVIILFGVIVGDGVIIGVGVIVMCDVFVGVMVVGNFVCLMLVKG